MRQQQHGMMRILCAPSTLYGTGVAFLMLSCTGRYQTAFERWATSDASSALASTPSGAGGSSGSGSSGVGTGSSGGADGGSAAASPEAGPTPPGTLSDAGTQNPPGGPSDAAAVGPSADSGSGSGGGPSDASASGQCSLAVTVTTVTDNGNYDPENVGAIWVAKSSGTFVKSLEVWAQARISHLTLWNSATSAAGLSRNKVDAITSASLSSYRTHMVSWNCTDTTRAIVPDGAYRVYFETTDQNSSGPNAYVDFTKGPAPFTLSPPNATYFTGIKLVFTP